MHTFSLIPLCRPGFPLDATVFYFTEICDEDASHFLTQDLNQMFLFLFEIMEVICPADQHAEQPNHLAEGQPLM